MNILAEAINAFKESMQSNGITPPSEIYERETITRFGKKKQFAYKFYFNDGHPAGWYKDWQTDFTFNWAFKTNAKTEFTQEEKKQFAKECQNKKRKEALIDKKKKADAKVEANQKWNNAELANNNHPYLVSKKIRSYGLRQLKGKLLIPIYIDGEISSLQTIANNGSKIFLPNGEIKSGYFEIKANPNIILIGEGYSTVASCYQATNYHCVIAFNAGNLKAVAFTIRHQYPQSQIILLADNDQWNSNGINIGVEKATEAAKAIDGTIIVPSFSDLSTKPTDFNDLATLQGIDEVKKQITQSLLQEPSKPSQECKYGIIPQRFSCNKEGVFYSTTDDTLKVTRAPVWVDAMSRDQHKKDWGMLVKFIDYDNNEQQLIIKKEIFHKKGHDVAEILARCGLNIKIGQEKTLALYLGSFETEKRLISTNSTGWIRDSFVLPDMIIHEPEKEKIVYQPEGYSNISNAISEKGSLEEWQKGIKDISPVLKFLTCASLSSPVRYKIGVEAGGIHIHDLTSQGKTTALQLCSSVWGNGVDPAIAGGDGAYIQRYNSTANGLEGKAEAFNDLSLVIDEIGEGEAKECGKTIYRLIAGTGKTRANRSGGLRNSKSWRVMIMSSGEVAISQFIESAGESAKGGQLVRMLDLDLSSMPSLFKGGEEADQMKEHCANYYGVAGREFIKRIKFFNEGWKEFDLNRIGEAKTPMAVRARKRFALIAHSGLLAKKAGVLQWSEKEIMDSCTLVYKSWLSNIDLISDVEKGIKSIAQFIMTNEIRFEMPNAISPPNIRAGWYRDNIYHFTTTAFKEACGNCDPVKVKRELNKIGILKTNKKGALSSLISVNNKKIVVVSVRKSILEK